MADTLTPKLHAALANPARMELYEAVTEAGPDGVTAAVLALRVSLHKNTVRFHLHQLQEAGLVSAHNETRSSRGRPHLVYTAVGVQGQPSAVPSSVSEGTGSGSAGSGNTGSGSSAPGDSSPEMIGVLADVLATTPRSESGTSDSFVGTFVGAGRRWAERMWDDSSGGLDLQSVLQNMGFAPQVEASTIELRSCPFREAGKNHPDIVCSVHRGVIEQIAELSGEASADRPPVLVPFASPQTCLVKMPTSSSVKLTSD